jgi:tRNA pseudouridine38-40 synthase
MAVPVNANLLTPPTPRVRFGVNQPPTVRFALTLHYDGAPYHGWQLQPHVPTVQGTLEAVLIELSGGSRITVTGSGRTDTGVHATGQVATVDLPPTWTPTSLAKSMNALLPTSIRVTQVRPVPPRFHPRFDARRRRYIYRVGTHPMAHSPFLSATCWAIGSGPELNPDHLREGAGRILGEHSFEAFARSGQEKRSYHCHVHEARWTPWIDPAPPLAVQEPLGWIFQITANRYLHHMVRYLVGTMVAAASGLRSVEELSLLLENGRGGTHTTSPPAPPQGLFLDAVEYEEEAMRLPSPFLHQEL